MPKIRYGATRTIRIPESRDDRLLEICRRIDKSPNYLINRAIEFSLSSANFERRVEDGKI
jgi:predicted transcriptional regulator